MDVTFSSQSGKLDKIDFGGSNWWSGNKNSPAEVTGSSPKTITSTNTPVTLTFDNNIDSDSDVLIVFYFTDSTLKNITIQQ